MNTIMDNCSAVICAFALNCEVTALSPTFFLTTYKQVHFTSHQFLRSQRFNYPLSTSLASQLVALGNLFNLKWKANIRSIF